MPSEISAILGATLSGAKYGAKIRFPHALVMAFLFRKGTLEEKIRIIVKSTLEHSRNLASFATVYKVSEQKLVRWKKSRGGEYLNVIPFLFFIVSFVLHLFDVRS